MAAYGSEKAPQVPGAHQSYRPYDEEEEWELDEAQEELRAYRHGSYEQQQQQYLNRSLVGAGSSLPVTLGRLPYPVIIPQRRPRERSRGFIRAYAPDLLRCGIDEPTFMAFLDGFEKATADSPLVGTVNLAGGIAGALPYAIAPPIGLAVQVAAGIYQEIQSRRHQNAYMSQMNDQLFRPRGLYCLIMAYSANSDNVAGHHNYNANSSSQAGMRGKFRSNDGITGPVEFPVSAELIFPDLEDSSDDEQEGQGVVKGTLSKAFENFKDRRDLKAQRKYVRKNPASALNSLMGPNLELTPKDLKKQARKFEKAERKEEKHERKRERKALKHPERAPRGPKKRKIRQDILYMMIINTPPTEEMENAIRVVGSQTNMLAQRNI